MIGVVRVATVLFFVALLVGSAPAGSATRTDDEKQEEKTETPSEETTETSTSDEEQTEEGKDTREEAADRKLAAADILVDNSNTGYIDNAIVRTQVRVRADSAGGADQPDRAEFFYAKCGCFANPALQGVLGPAFDPSAPGPGDLPETDVSYQDLETTVEYAFMKNRFSLLAELPVRRVELGDNDFTSSGLADLRLGAKVALLASEGRHLTFQLKAYLPTGDAREGLSTDTSSWEPGLLYFQRFANRSVLESELRYYHPTSGSAGVPTDSSEEFSADIVRLGVGFGYDFPLSSGRRITPVAELVGWRVLGGFKTPSQGEADADGDTIVNLKLGARLGFGGKARGSLYLGYGTALTDEVWYQDIVRLEYRYGPF